jgi:hypothetical protein
MSGLYTRSNLSESGLNATDAVQKLYEPQVQQDLLLFAFASRLESQISSPSLVAENQIFALINEPISDSSGNVFLRTKFLTNGFTFSENNLVWLDRVNFPLDKRSSSETEGCSVIFSVNSSLTQVSLESGGEKYVVRDSSGALVSLPSTVQVRLRGVESGASNAVASVTVEQDGRLSRSVSLVTGGSNYIDGEFLEIVLGCREDETPTLHKCFVYTGSNYLDQVGFDQDGRSAQALLRSVKYTYTTRFSDGEGFFLYDDLEQKWMYLGSDYDQLSLISGSSPPLLSMKRLDTLSSDNMTQLFQLDGRSQFFDYGQTYQSGESIGGSIRGLLNRAEELKDTFKYFVQNNRVNTPETSENNQLGTRFNIIDGKNILSDFRVIFRDPDGSIDQPGQQSLSGVEIPSTTYTITETYSGTPIRGYLYVPEIEKSQLDVVMLLHPTIEAPGSTPLDAAQMFLGLAKDPNGLSLGDKIIFSVAYPQDNIPGWTQAQANDLFPGINLSNFYFGDNITYVEAALLWAKNSLNAYLASQGINKSTGKLFTFGHSQGGLLVHRLNTMHQVDGVVANAPGPIDLLARCQYSEANGDESPSCLKLKTAYGSTEVSPSTYNNVSLKNFLAGTLSPALFTQALDDTTGNSAGVPQVQNMQTIVQPGLEACTTCAAVTFKYYANGGHAAFSSNAALQEDIRGFVGSIREPASTFAALSGLDGSDTLRINGATIPGIWLFSGDKYKRVFSSDEKPFLFQQGLKTYSPAIFNPQTGNELAGSGSFKFSLSTAFAPSGQTTIRGFDVQLNTLVQNISTTAGGGGFVYHRQLSTQTVSGSVTSWPLFSYRDGLTIKDARLLAI